MRREPERTVPLPASLIYQLSSYVERIDVAQVFQKAQPLQLELGSGDGSFLAQWAVLNPAFNFLGVERLLGRLRKLERKGQRVGLTNLRALRIEASYLLNYLLPGRAVHSLHVYFPDPWPKRKHRKNRLVNESFPTSAARVLASGGAVYLRTDDADYFAQMRAVFGANAQFHAVETPEDLQATLTDFERGFQARGVPTLRAAYQLAGV